MKAKKLICIGTIFLTLMTGQITNAANWKQVLKEDPETGMTEYVDTDSIQKIDYDTRKAWIKITTPKEEPQMLLLAFTKDGQVKLLDYVESNKSPENIPPIADTWENIYPDSFVEKAYNVVWPVKERKIKKESNPNRWEQKGEETANRAANRVINKVLNKIGGGWDWY